MLQVSVFDEIGRIDPREWDACAGSCCDSERPRDPFTTHRFLHSLEQSNSVGPDSGWIPKHLVATDRGVPFAVMPLYVKLHSQGEYVFDHGWAHAFERAGGQYYPKLQATVPFTPATGRRFLTLPGREADGMATLAAAAVKLASNNALSSLHVTFCTESEAGSGEKLGFLRRSGEQFHWINNGYGDFEEFLSVLSSRKRNNIRKERRKANAFGGVIRALTGTDIEPRHWDFFWQFYQDTGSRKWGRPYLARRFFDEIHEKMRKDLLLVLCERDGRPIAGALNFIGQQTLYGRYWGCLESHPCLHFEACYYRAIEFAINAGLQRVEAGAQGPHKLARGYMPTTVHSLHWIADPNFREAVSEYLDLESREIDSEIAYLSSISPFKKS
ncbi:MAG: GNAT family N-acetyltransferase [Albidovulum sp.]|nr:GNAT family N-acetyltransferase [Albidovulum sp.]